METGILKMHLNYVHNNVSYKVTQHTFIARAPFLPLNITSQYTLLLTKKPCVTNHYCCRALLQANFI
jgi:hypothetical protein